VGDALKGQAVSDALMGVMLGSSRPVTPTYPPDRPLAKIKR
jgi:hypothetical protein